MGQPDRSNAVQRLLMVRAGPLEAKDFATLKSIRMSELPLPPSDPPDAPPTCSEYSPRDVTVATSSDLPWRAGWIFAGRHQTDERFLVLDEEHVLRDISPKATSPRRRS